MKLLRKQYGDMMKSRMQDEELANMLTGIGSDKIFVNFAATHMDIDVELKYGLLACDNYYERVERMLENLNTLKGLDELRREIDNKTKDEMERQQREYLRRIGYGVTIVNEVSTPNGIASVMVDNTYHLLGMGAGADENE